MVAIEGEEDVLDHGKDDGVEIAGGFAGHHLMTHGHHDPNDRASASRTVAR